MGLVIWLASLDLRWFTSACLIGLGLALTYVARHVWWTSPAERASLLGPYLTDAGLRFVLRAWPLVFILGLWFVTAGVSKLAFYARWRGALATEIANGIGLLEAIFSLWVVGSVVWVTVRTWRGR